MHAIFALYGKKERVDTLIRDLTAQKLTIRFYNKETKEEKHIWIDCQLRMLPGGFYDYIFPKEHEDLVLASLNYHEKGGIYDLDLDKSYFGIKPLELLKRFLKIEEPPKNINTDKKLLWDQQHVTIIPIGVKYDGEIQEPAGPDKDWWHERI